MKQFTLLELLFPIFNDILKIWRPIVSYLIFVYIFNAKFDFKSIDYNVYVE